MLSVSQHEVSQFHTLNQHCAGDYGNMPECNLAAGLLQKKWCGPALLYIAWDIRVVVFQAGSVLKI